MQHGGSRLELLIFEKAADQLRARVFRFFADRVGIRRQKHSRFDVNQLGRDDEELRRDIDVQFLHEAYIGEVLLGDLRDGNVIDVELLSPDHVQKQLERTFK